MQNLTSYSRHPQDEPVLQQLETHLQHLSFDKKAAVTRAMPTAVCSSTMLRKRFATIAEDLSVLEQLQEAIA